MNELSERCQSYRDEANKPLAKRLLTKVFERTEGEQRMKLGHRMRPLPEVLSAKTRLVVSATDEYEHPSYNRDSIMDVGSTTHKKTLPLSTKSIPGPGEVREGGEVLRNYHDIKMRAKDTYHVSSPHLHKRVLEYVDKHIRDSIREKKACTHNKFEGIAFRPVSDMYTTMRRLGGGNI